MPSRSASRRATIALATALVLIASSARPEPPAIEDTTIVLTAAERDDFARVRAFLADSTHAADAHLRTFVGVSLAMVDDADTASLHPATIDALAEQARGSTDPMVLALLVQACAWDRRVPKPTCDPVAIATRWTIADTQNRMAWLTLASTLRHAGRSAEADAAFGRAAGASLWREAYDDGSRVVDAGLPKALGARARLAVQSAALAWSAAWLTSMSAIQELSTRCKDPALRDACLRIAVAVDGEGVSLQTRQVAASIARRYGNDVEAADRRQRELDVLQYAASHGRLKAWDEIPDAAELDVQVALLDRRIALGEVAWSKSELDRGGPAMRAAAERDHAESTVARRRAEVDEKRRQADRAALDR